jgi:hypothetical protein
MENGYCIDILGRQGRQKPERRSSTSFFSTVSILFHILIRGFEYREQLIDS